MAAVPGRFVPPVVVVELGLGILVGPQLLDIAKTDDFIEFFSNLGLGMLFFFAGYEIDFERIKGAPLKLGSWGWLLSIVIAYAIGGAAGGGGDDRLRPLRRLGDGDDRDRHPDPDPARRRRAADPLRDLPDGGRRGRRVRADPARHPLPLHRPTRCTRRLILIAFVILALAVALISVRLAWRGWPALERTFEASSQLAVRVTVVLVFGLVLLAGKLGLDVLIGGFVAGLITRLALKGHEVQVFESKLTAVGFGFFVPFFFVTSGIQFNLDALGSVGAMLKLAMFFALFLVVRGTPAMLLYRGVLELRDRAALAFYSATELPLVVAITTIATETGHMKSSTAAGLVGAAMLSTLVYPFVGLALRRRSEEETAEPPDEGPPPAPRPDYPAESP